MNKQWKKHCKISGGRTTRWWTRHINKDYSNVNLNLGIAFWHLQLMTHQKRKTKTNTQKGKTTKALQMVTRRRNVEAPCHPSCQGHDPEPPEIRFEIRSEKTTRVFFSNEFRRQKIEGQQKGNNTRKLLLRCWPKMLSYSIEAFLPNACSKKSGSAQQATRKCLGSDFKSNSGFNMIQPMLQQNPSEPLRICPSLSRRRSSNQATQSSSHGHAPNRTWSYLANLHWKTIFGIMKHSETSPFIASLSHVSWFYHLYHVTYLVSSFPLAALARLRQTSSDP